jgi:hypothetical protein
MTRMCPDCRAGKHPNCAGFAFDENDQQVPCPCRRCHPPAPIKCTSCGGLVNPYTAECAGCSD